MLTLKQYGNKIWAIVGDTRDEVALSFIRFQEYYENPVYKGKVGFTVQDIEQWQTTVSNKPYEQCWAGFNIPGKIVEEVYFAGEHDMSNGFFPFTQYEQALLHLIFQKFIRVELADLYFIGVARDQPEFDSIIMHEVAHGLFKTNHQYRIAQLQNIKQLPTQTQSLVSNILLELGYCDDVIEDETHAYLLTDIDLLLDYNPDLVLQSYTKNILDTYNKFTTTSEHKQTPKISWFKKLCLFLIGSPQQW